MNLKIYLIACVSIFLVSLPQNIISCGPGIDPYDYYTSFFQNDLGNDPSLKPFYYTGMSFLYDETDVLSREDELAKDWSGFTSGAVTKGDAYNFVMKFSWKDLNSLYNFIDKKKPFAAPDSVKENGFTTYFLQSKDLETLGYLMFAKKAEPFVTQSYNSWDEVNTDSLKLEKLKKDGYQLYNASKKDFIKQRYAYQVMRLALYNNQPAEALQVFKSNFKNDISANTIANQAFGLAAGALYRSGQEAEAAYIYSKLFSNSDVYKLKNYLSFRWATGDDNMIAKALALCQSAEERANLLALQAFTIPAEALPVLKNIQQTEANIPVLKTLAVREINKLEEKLLTPALAKENGGKVFYYTWQDINEDSAFDAQKVYGRSVQNFFKQIAEMPGTKDKGFYTLAAAYVAYMTRDLTAAKQLLSDAAKLPMSAKEEDQYELTKLLVTVNDQSLIDQDFEAKILASVEWLKKKAIEEKVKEINYYPQSQWKNFYRNFFSEIMAKRYRKQGDKVKEVLSVGVAEQIWSNQENDFYSEGSSVFFMHDNMDSKDVEALYTLMTSVTKTPYETYMVKHNAIRGKQVVDFAGTAHLRNYDYAAALKWFKKTPALSVNRIEKDPFIDLLYDQEERLPKEKGYTTKQAFAAEMLRLENVIKTDKVNGAQAAYKYALGLYNMTYYGHAWELVEYYRSGADGYSIPKNATTFKKEYYGAYSAEAAFEKAKNLFTDKNMQARCLFMMAKCAQKQVQAPDYYAFKEWEQYDTARKTYFDQFKANSYFPALIKEYGSTSFYKEAYSRCSYLRDFVRK